MLTPTHLVSAQSAYLGACILAAHPPDLLEALRLILEEPSYDLLETHRSFAFQAVAKAEGVKLEVDT